MLIESVAGLVAVRRRTVALRLGDAVGEPLFGGTVFGLAACGALAGDPQVDDFSHVQQVPNERWSWAFSASAISANCADTVAAEHDNAKPV
jgi:hypothetical protein